MNDQLLIDEVYRRRARQLAERPAAVADSTTVAVLVFGLGTERYAMALSDLAEVFAYRGCTAVPGTPPALLGVMNLRGDIRLIVDLGCVLELAPAGGNPRGYVVVLRHHGRTVGLRVDTIEEVRQIDAAQLTSAHPEAGAILGSRFARGLTADTVILIDSSAVLSSLGL